MHSFSEMTAVPPPAFVDARIASGVNVFAIRNGNREGIPGRLLRAATVHGAFATTSVSSDNVNAAGNSK